MASRNYRGESLWEFDVCEILMSRSLLARRRKALSRQTVTTLEKKGRTIFPRKQLFITSDKLYSLDFIKQVRPRKQF